MLRHAGLGRESFFDIKAEAQTAFVAARQFGNHTDHLDVPTLPFIRQADGKALFSLPRGVMETQPAGKSGEEQGVYRASKPVLPAKA